MISKITIYDNVVDLIGGEMPRPFEGLLGNSSELKIIEFLLPLKDMEFNVTELAKEVNASRPTVDRIVKKFVKWGLMKIAYSHGNTKYYGLNRDSGFIEVFENLNNRLIEQMLGEDALSQVGDYWLQHAPVCSPKPMPLSEEVAGWIQAASGRQSELSGSVFIRDIRDFPNNVITIGGANAA